MRFFGVTVTDGTQLFTFSLRGGLLVSGTSLLSESLLPSTISNATGLDIGGSVGTLLTPAEKENVSIPYGEHSESLEQDSLFQNAHSISH